MYKMTLAIAGLLLLLVGYADAASAQLTSTLLNGSVIHQSDNTYLYIYDIDNGFQSSVPVVEFTLSIEPSANIEKITGPKGWEITYKSSDKVIDWSILPSFPGLLPGGKAEFSFISTSPPSQQNYLILGGSTLPVAIQTKQGKVVSPGIADSKATKDSNQP